MSDQTRHRTKSASEDIKEMFMDLSKLFARWGQFSQAEKDEVRSWFVEEFIPLLPKEMLSAWEKFLKDRCS